MLAAIRVTPRLACGLLRAGHNLTHLADHAEQRRLIHLFAPLLPQFRQRLPLFPEGDSRMRQGTVGNFQVMLSLRFQDPDTADVARIAPDQKGRPAFTPRNPRLERIGVVVDVVDDKAGAGQRAPEDRQKIDQERSSACDDGRYADTRHGLGPARGRRLEQAVVHRTVVGADRQCEPAL
ncbi:Uncharacterised protein [Escherichia coli]|nr:Uncharacterised protein [Escherichia coli]